MKYWEETEDGTKKPVEKEVTKNSVVNTLEQIERGYMPDWNYEANEGISIPDEYYPLHVAMDIAIEAVKAQGDEFFKAQDKKYKKF